MSMTRPSELVKYLKSLSRKREGDSAAEGGEAPRPDELLLRGQAGAQGQAEEDGNVIARNKRKRPSQTSRQRPPGSAVDPTRTVTLRLAAVRMVRKKFARLKGLLVKLVVGEDAFGLRERKPYRVVNVDRIEMPQIRKEHWQRFLKYARERTTLTEGSGVDPKSLRAVQSEFSQERVDKIPAESLQWPVLVSQDSYVLDGNHRWIKAYQTNTPMKVLRLGLDKDDALALMREFPQSEFVGNRFQFHSSPDKVLEFQKWLRQQFKAVLLGKSDEELWAEFAQRGYEKGAGRAFDDVNKKRRWLPGEGDFYGRSKQQFLKSSFGRAESTDKLRLLASRSFTDLTNVTEDMAARMSRTLMDGLARGANPRELVAGLVEDLDISETRAETIARTEIIRAHAEGQLDSMEKLGVEEVGVAVEWSTAGDLRVCKHCKPLEGVVLTIQEAHGMIPNHVNCRCSFVPANVGENQDKQKRTKAEILEAFEEADVEPPELKGQRSEPLVEPVKNEDVTSCSELHEFSRLLHNAFCPTGEGGGVDPTCSVGVSKFVGEVVGKAEHEHAAKVERDVARAIGGEWEDDNAPYDVVKGKDGVEVKTLLKGSKTSISVHPDALVRKYDWVRGQSGREFHTVVVDERDTFGDGAYSDKFSGNRYYYKRGSGRYSLSQMHQVGSLAEVKKLIATDAETLPEKARGSLPGRGEIKNLREQAEKTRQYRVEQNRKRRAEGKI